MMENNSRCLVHDVCSDDNEADKSVLQSVEQRRVAEFSDQKETPNDDRAKKARMRFQLLANKVKKNSKDRISQHTTLQKVVLTALQQKRKENTINFCHQSPTAGQKIPSGAGRFIDEAVAVEKFLHRNTVDPDITDEDKDRAHSSDHERGQNDEVAPLRSGTGFSDLKIQYGGVDGPQISQQSPLSSQSTHKRDGKQLYPVKRRHWFARSTSGVFHIVDRKSIYEGLVKTLFCSSVTFIAVPAMIAATVLCYGCGNPSAPFQMESQHKSTLSWWLIFLSRQAIMFELARIVEHFVVHGLMLKTTWFVKLCGPLVTLFAIQSSGWPFVLVCWSICDIIFLRGKMKFQQNWFYFTGLEIFSEANEGGHVLLSGEYFRILLAVLFAGLAHSVKRTIVAMYFGKRTFLTYKDRLEKLLVDIVLVAEVAELAEEAGFFSNSLGSCYDCKEDPVSSARADLFRPHDLKSQQWKSVRKNLNIAYVVGVGEVESGDDIEFVPATEDENISFGGLTDDESECSDDNCTGDHRLRGHSSSSHRKKKYAPNFTNQSRASSHRSSINDASLRMTTLGSSNRLQNQKQRKKIQDNFDLYEEKFSCGIEKTTDSSISDILNFQRALAYMKDDSPFSDSFGPAQTRSQCINASQNCFSKLTNFGGGKSSVSFDTLALLATNDYGDIDLDKVGALKRLFRPDQGEDITELAFVQSIDTVYKRLRFFRASVANFTKIDKVLEDGIDVVFHLLIGLGLLLLLNFNPYPLLVSISTLMVSLAFALGPSVSKCIEGFLLIAVRRPYDLGDRILVSAANTNPPVPDTTVQNAAAMAWIVEDINLFYTKIRFAQTNEFATISNGSIAMSRIVNFARSPNALVTLRFRFDIKAPKDRIGRFRLKVEKYVNERPRQWESILFFRLVHAKENYREHILKVRHHRSWQDTSTVAVSKADLLDFCLDMVKRYDIRYDGGLHCGSVEERMRGEETGNNFSPKHSSVLPAKKNHS